MTTTGNASTSRFGETLLLLLDIAPDAVLCVDRQGRILRANPNSEQLFGYDRGELAGQLIEVLIPERTREHHAWRSDGFLSSLRPRAIGAALEFQARRKDGSEFPVDIMLKSLPELADGAIVATLRNIGPQKQLETDLMLRSAELAAATALLHDILDSSTRHAIVAVDLAGAVVAWNTGAHRLFGRSADAMLGQDYWSSLLHPAEYQPAGAITTLLNTVLTSGNAEMRLECLHVDGSRFVASESLTLRCAADGNPVGFLVIAEDISERNRLEIQLARKNDELKEQYRRMQESSRLKSEFLANMSHELRTPLNAIIGFSEILHDGRVGVLAADHREYIGDILTSARHLLRTINNVLDLAKIEAGKMEFRPVPVVLDRVVGEVRDVVRSLLAQKRLHLDISIAPELTDVVIDPAKLKQVLYNYLSNAIKFTPDEGRITIRVTAIDSASFRVEVEDNGIGIKPEEIAQVFVEFRQLDSTYSKRHQGTGLGLALTRRIVEAQGGQVGVDSRPGYGSLFYADLPRHPGSIPDAATAAPLPSGPGAAILVVEDDPRDREWIAKVLAAAGYSVDAAVDGAHALELCRKRAYAAVTLDLLLPDMTGWELLSAIRMNGLNVATPAIVLSVVADRAAGSVFDVRDYLVKPAVADDLLAALRRAGVATSNHSKVVVLNSKPRALETIAAMLWEGGYNTFCTEDRNEALQLVQQHAPDALVLDLPPDGGDCFNFLSQLRESPAGRELLVFVCTEMQLNHDDMARLQPIAQVIIHKGEEDSRQLLSELRTALGKPDHAVAT